MVGGTVVQVSGSAVEVLDGTYFDRCWRKLDHPEQVRVGDVLWWQSFGGYLSRRPEFTDKKIGRCVPCNPHGRS